MKKLNEERAKVAQQRRQVEDARARLGQDKAAFEKRKVCHHAADLCGSAPCWAMWCTPGMGFAEPPPAPALHSACWQGIPVHQAAAEPEGVPVVRHHLPALIACATCWQRTAVAHVNCG